MRTVLSSDADARRFPSGENAQPNTALDNSKGYSKLLNQVAVQIFDYCIPSMVADCFDCFAPWSLPDAQGSIITSRGNELT